MFLAANPSDTSCLRLDEEARAIESKMRGSRYRDSFLFKTHWALRPDDLQQAILDENPTIVHFSGHGCPSRGLVVHGHHGVAQPVTADALRRLFAILRDNIRVVLFNACYSTEHANAVAEIIDVVIGMSGRVGDEAARIFSSAFYRALGAGRSVGNAFDLGVNALGLEGLTVEDDIPILRERPGVRADSIVLAPVRAASVE